MCIHSLYFVTGSQKPKLLYHAAIIPCFKTVSCSFGSPIINIQLLHCCLMIVSMITLIKKKSKPQKIILCSKRSQLLSFLPIRSSLFQLNQFWFGWWLNLVWAYTEQYNTKFLSNIFSLSRQDDKVYQKSYVDLHYWQRFKIHWYQNLQINILSQSR